MQRLRLFGLEQVANRDSRSNPGMKLENLCNLAVVFCSASCSLRQTQRMHYWEMGQFFVVTTHECEWQN